MDKLVLLPSEAQNMIIAKVQSAMLAQGIECALISSNTNIFYLTGRVYSGYVLLRASQDPIYLVKRPVRLCADNAIEIHKPELILAALADRGITLPDKIALELGSLTYNMATRLSKALEIKTLCDISALMSAVRSTKTPYEISQIRLSAIKHQQVYHRIPTLYQPGMSDLELQIEIERMSRYEGCLGQFRINGTEMDLFMGNVLVGDNADAPSPFDFAMGGAGSAPSLPIGANGTIIKPGHTVMVDMNGNFTGYMTDMTRCYSVGNIDPRAIAAHQVSIEICHALAEMGTPGTPAKALYDQAMAMATEAHLKDYFMGHHQQAGFVGHGVGIEINELPVLAPRSRDTLQEGNVIAVEPKFVIPGVGAVGIENTYLVKAQGGMECLTPAPEQLIQLD